MNIRPNWPEVSIMTAEGVDKYDRPGLRTQKSIFKDPDLAQKIRLVELYKISIKSNFRP